MISPPNLDHLVDAIADAIDDCEIELTMKEEVDFFDIKAIYDLSIESNSKFTISEEQRRLLNKLARLVPR